MMKLYPKQLNSLEELRREKHVLRYAKKHTDDWLNFKDLDKGKQQGGQATGAGLVDVLLSAAGSKSMFSAVLAVAPTVFSLLSKTSLSGRKLTKPLERLAKDVLVGYVKWKLIHFAYSGLMSLVSSKKDQKDTKKEHE